MGVEEARNVVLEVAKPPAKMISFYSGPFLSLSVGDTIREDNYKLYLRATSLRVYGRYKYDIPFKDLSPRQVGPHVDLFDRFNAFGSGQVLQVDDRGFANLPDHQYFDGIEEARARRLVDALSVLKNAVPQLATDEEVLFHEAARAYRASNPKSQLPEAARRFKVQAEGAVHDKDYGAAAEFYGQAIGVAPWWPEGHFNRALVLSNTGDYELAIVEMKRYLELMPDAQDARAAQDKVYEWEPKVK